MFGRKPFLTALGSPMVALILAAGTGCRWSKEDIDIFNQEMQLFCDKIDKYVADGQEDVKRIGAHSRKAAEDLDIQYAKSAKELRDTKLEAVQAFNYCQEDKLVQLLKTAMRILEKVPVKLKPILGLLGVIADEYDIDISGTASAAPGRLAGFRRVYTIDSQSRVVAGRGAALGILPIRQTIPVHGSMTASFEPADPAMAVRIEDLIIDAALDATRRITLAEPEGGISMTAQRDDVVYRSGWKATFQGEILVGLFTDPGPEDGAEKHERMNLGFYFSSDFMSFSMTTLGLKASGDVFPPEPPAPPTHVWGFGAAADLIAGQEVLFFIEHAEPKAAFEVFMSPHLAFPAGTFDGAEWSLDASQQVQIGGGTIDERGGGWISHVPESRAAGSYQFFQAIVHGARETKSTATYGDRVERLFRRGDANADARVDLTDAVFTFNYLFGGAREPLCLEAADTDSSGSLNISDPIRLLHWLFRGGEEPVAPGPHSCGTPKAEEAGTMRLTCAEYGSCS